VSVVEFFFPFM